VVHDAWGCFHHRWLSALAVWVDAAKAGRPHVCLSLHDPLDSKTDFMNDKGMNRFHGNETEM
jgi:hypothetical protein